MTDVNMKHVAMIKSGITPRLLERCRSKTEMREMANLKGWPEADVLGFARDIGLFEKGAKR